MPPTHRFARRTWARSDSGVAEPTGPPPRKQPGDYRPDLRPMLILGVVLVAVVIAWIVLSPLILPR